MIIQVDTATVPPGVALADTQNLRELELVLIVAEHAWVAPSTIVELAGEHAGDPGWLAEFEAMIAFARSRGWLDAAGNVRVHLAATAASTPAKPE